ncbi:MAG: hypothetical protein R2749_18020 [Acidimicrobiales bacterium]
MSPVGGGHERPAKTASWASSGASLLGRFDEGLVLGEGDDQLVDGVERHGGRLLEAVEGGGRRGEHILGLQGALSPQGRLERLGEADGGGVAPLLLVGVGDAAEQHHGDPRAGAHEHGERSTRT